MKITLYNRLDGNTDFLFLTTLTSFLIKKGIHCGTHLKSRGTHFKTELICQLFNLNQLEYAPRKNHNFVCNKCEQD